jgi:hypothetical protein
MEQESFWLKWYNLHVCVLILQMSHLCILTCKTSYINLNCFFKMCQNCQQSILYYDYIIAKPFKKCPVCQVDVQGWSHCSQTNSRGEVTSHFKNSK